MVNSVGSSTTTNTTNLTDNAAQSGLRQQDFLKLMVAQVQNQDPMSPQPNGEFLSQLAQFSTNDGINNMQASLQQLATSLQSNQALQASALVGRKVLVETNTMTLGSEGSVKASIDAVSGMNDATASIYSSAGELIKKIPLGQTKVGSNEFAWDGTDESNKRVASGQYTVKVSANYGGKQVAVPTIISSNVDSVTLGQNGDSLKLNVAGVGQVTLDKVRQISG